MAETLTPGNIELLTPNARRLTFRVSQLLDQKYWGKIKGSELTFIKKGSSFGSYSYPHPLDNRMGAWSGHETHLRFANRWPKLYTLLRQLWNTNCFALVTAEQPEKDFDSAEYQAIYVLAILKETDDDLDVLWDIILKDICGVSAAWQPTFKAFE